MRRVGEIQLVSAECRDGSVELLSHPIIVAMRSRLLAVVLLLSPACFFVVAQDLRIDVPASQRVIVGQQFTLPLTTSGGSTPYTWQLVSGDLPPGLKLQHHQGKIVGTPTEPGTYHFTIAVQDSSIPQLQLRRDINLHVIAGLTVEWKDSPQVQGSKIAGSAVVSNHTPDDFDLTFVVVAVNQYGRATALGYQHFTVSGNTNSQIIPFASTPGIGSYYVRADAVAHHPGKKRVFRASLQTPPSIKVADF
jgi:putative Ig domain-containing protein